MATMATKNTMTSQITFVILVAVVNLVLAIGVDVICERRSAFYSIMQKVIVRIVSSCPSCWPSAFRCDCKTPRAIHS
jgi:hypothetical protein